MQALAQDQLRALLGMTKGFDVDFNIGIYDGDTSQSERTWLRENSRLVICQLICFLDQTGSGEMCFILYYIAVDHKSRYVTHINLVSPSAI